MPTQIDLQREASALPNRFEDKAPHITEYTAQDIATLQSRLDKQLGPEYISSRPGAGGIRVYYLAAEKAINLANEVFGFNGWSSGIKTVQVDFVDEDRNTGKISLGLSIITRVTLRDGTFHEDIGYGHIENCKGKAAAFEKAKKEAATDALKRALRNFGNILGNCLYDRQYLQRVTKVKAEPSRWSVDNLHRHPDFDPPKKEQAPNMHANEESKQPGTTAVASDAACIGEDYDEFGGDVFEDTDMSHPDEVVLESLISENETLLSRPYGRTQDQQRQQIPRTRSMPSYPPTIEGQPPAPPNGVQIPTAPASPKQDIHTRRMIPPQANGHHPARTTGMPPPPVPKQAEQGPVTRPCPPQPNANVNALSNNPPTHQAGFANTKSPLHRELPLQQPGPIHQQSPVGFIASRAAEVFTKSDALPAQVNSVPAFNPHAESPSIRRTNGINHAKSEPIIKKSLASPGGLAVGPPHAGRSVGGAETSVASRAIRGSAQVPPNFVNPQADPGRKIGMPGSGVASPLANRGVYKSPITKRLAPGSEIAGGGGGGGPGRPPLTDVSNVTADARGALGGSDGAKRADASTDINLEGDGDTKRLKLDSKP